MSDLCRVSIEELEHDRRCSAQEASFESVREIAEAGERAQLTLATIWETYLDREGSDEACEMIFNEELMNLPLCDAGVFYGEIVGNGTEVDIEICVMYETLVEIQGELVEENVQLNWQNYL